MANTRRRRRHRVLALTAAGAVAVLVGLVVVGLWILMRSPESPPRATPPTAQPPGTTTTPGSKPRPEFQDASCADVMVLSIPGTWESSPQMDPLNPTQFPIALLLNVTNPLRQAFGEDRVVTYTVPYTAQFHNPFAADNQMSYNDSRNEGMKAAVQALTDMNNRCPLTSYVIVGFSQGAVIAGDIASDIGNGRGPVDADLVLGVTLIADGRRQDGIGQNIGPDPAGQGAEITLQEVPTLSALGLTMTGPRPGGFGSLADRTNQICGPGDLICSAPEGAFSIINLPKTLETLSGGAGQPVHALYNTPQFWSLNGQTATQWTEAWAQGLIDNAPHPKHG
ncbi:cutinase family protein [Mycolicibacterium sp.]|uniref:carboxylesterase Culp6 n=1 Tax=Mycolicibacterium sp. TaxID=2320850 RepID=UPI001A1F0AD3|nr:cutinase family protein [Mycolicibacterium sp.]MBJ7340832.1 cutinase family protein [Mycolicibacterium sp.]